MIASLGRGWEHFLYNSSGLRCCELFPVFTEQNNFFSKSRDLRSAFYCLTSTFIIALYHSFSPNFIEDLNLCFDLFQKDLESRKYVDKIILGHDALLHFSSVRNIHCCKHNLSIFPSRLSKALLSQQVGSAIGWNQLLLRDCNQLFHCVVNAGNLFLYALAIIATRLDAFNTR